MTAAIPAELRAERQRERNRALTMYVRKAKREQRQSLEIWRPAFEGGQGLLPVDYGTAELVRREKDEEQ